MRMGLHRDDIWVYSELTKLKRERLQVCVGERLIRKVNYRMPGPCLFYLFEYSCREWLINRNTINPSSKTVSLGFYQNMPKVAVHHRSPFLSFL